MKNWLKRNIGIIAGACLGISFYYPLGSTSLLFFGEPEFPTED